MNPNAQEVMVCAQQSLGHLEESLKKLCAIVASVFDEIQIGAEDHMAFMAISFLSKQHDHATAILQLSSHPDSSLIARSMLEGRCLLVWAREKSDERPIQWRAFVWIHDWRLMRSGFSVSTERWADIEANVKKYQHLFWTRRARAAMNQGKALPHDPFIKRWPDFPIVDLFEQVEASKLYENLYRSFSDWHHWTIAGVGRALQYSNGEFVYRSDSVNEQATALAVAFQCLYETALIADCTCTLRIKERLLNLAADYQLGVKLPVASEQVDT